MDTDHALAAGYGLTHGGTAVIRPDGYLGLRGGPDVDVAGYFYQAHVVTRSYNRSKVPLARSTRASTASRRGQRTRSPRPGGDPGPVLPASAMT